MNLSLGKLDDMQYQCASQGAAGRLPAAQCYSEALRQDPSLAAAWRGLGDLRRECGDLEGSLSYYQHALRLQPDCAEALTGLGFALKDLKRHGEAQACLEVAVRSRPQCALALGALAGRTSTGGASPAVQLLERHFCYPIAAS